MVVKLIEFELEDLIEDLDYDLTFFRNWKSFNTEDSYDDFELKAFGTLDYKQILEGVKTSIENESLFDSFKIKITGTIELEGIEFEFKGEPFFNPIENTLHFTEDNLRKI